MSLDELKALRPEERIRRLKELEEKRRQEIEEAHKLIKESEEEIEDEQKKKELMPVEQLKSVSEDTLMGESEKEVFRSQRFAEGDEDSTHSEPVDLEGTVHRDPAAQTQSGGDSGSGVYVSQLSQKPVKELTSEIYQLAQDIESGSAGEENINRLYTLHQAMGQKRADIESGAYNPGDVSTASEVDIGYKLTEAFLGSYDRGNMDAYRRAGG